MYKLKQVQKDTSTIVGNLEQLLEAFALLIVASYAVWNAYHGHMQIVYAYVLGISGGIIGLRGAAEFIKHLKK